VPKASRASFTPSWLQAGQPLDDQLVLFDQDPLVHLDGEAPRAAARLGQDRSQPGAEAGR